MKFGPHTPEVEEVIAFVEAGGVLAKPFDPAEAVEAGFETLVVTTLDGIGRYRDPWEDDARIGDTIWQYDIKRCDNRAWYFKGFTADDEVARRMAPVFEQEERRLRGLLTRRLIDVLPSDEILTVSDDFEVLMRARTAIGRSRIFPERLFDVYRAGGYPCGWEGSFPEGRLVVFSR